MNVRLTLGAIGIAMILTVLLVGFCEPVAYAQDPSPTPTPTPTPTQVIIVPEPVDPPPFVPEDIRTEGQTARTPSGYAELDADVTFSLQTNKIYNVNDIRSYTQSQLTQRTACSVGPRQTGQNLLNSITAPVLWQAFRLKGSDLWNISFKTAEVTFTIETVFNGISRHIRYTKAVNSATDRLGWPYSGPLAAAERTYEYVAGAACFSGTFNGPGNITNDLLTTFQLHQIAITRVWNYTDKLIQQYLQSVSLGLDISNFSDTQHDFYFDGYADVASSEAVPVAAEYLSSSSEIRATEVDFTFRSGDTGRADYYIAGYYDVDESVLGTGAYRRNADGREFFTHRVSSLVTDSVYRFFVTPYYTPTGVHRGGARALPSTTLEQDLTVPENASNPTDRRPRTGPAPISDDDKTATAVAADMTATAVSRDMTATALAELTDDERTATAESADMTATAISADMTATAVSAALTPTAKHTLSLIHI